MDQKPLPPGAIPGTPAQIAIMTTMQNEFLPIFKKLQDLLKRVQECRVSYEPYFSKLKELEDECGTISDKFWSVSIKLTTPDILFEGILPEPEPNTPPSIERMQTMATFVQFSPGISKNVEEGSRYLDLINKTLDRRGQTVQNNRTMYLAIAAIVVSIIVPLLRGM